MDSGPLMAAFFFGLLGLGLFGYGRKAARPVPLLAGAALMIVPYFISNFAALVLVCSGIAALPWFLRNA